MCATGSPGRGRRHEGAFDAQVRASVSWRPQASSDSVLQHLVPGFVVRSYNRHKPFLTPHNAIRKVRRIWRWRNTM